ncbi:OmpA/MotB domain protein [Magnetococcus marinus MC-1]|uniref:OmpA/MotB domain protein n=1 Tax=Magnetococcus marinus (strain ATCC BAA-1437 / JCM 17883 / MC-1) TaxID=156889 RepID=A0L6C4_MAGMM|nr:OmpA family protein [Magnetococcus marinus]ABK43517.1 OmpA/MotB domain protein [Magnetococcus marinus MC-1]
MNLRKLPERKRLDVGDNPFWISYADLMTALVMLFLVVMSISMIAVASRDEVRQNQRKDEITKVFDALEQSAAQSNLPLVINRKEQTLSFGNSARFELDSFYLSAQVRQQLKDFVPMLLKVRKKGEGKWLKRVHIEGYTDDIGTYLYNVRLSMNRAQAVLCTLMEAEVSEAQRRELQRMIIIDGAASTSIRSSREESRRVEIRLEFLRHDEVLAAQPEWEMPLGRCPIPLEPEVGEKPKVLDEPLPPFPGTTNREE